jgi:hypothetical protein
MRNQPITSFGIHQATIKDLETFELFDMLILDSAEPDFAQEMIDLRGGSSAFPWASAPGEASGEISMTVKQFDRGVLKFFSPYVAGSIEETVAGEASGDVSALTNVIGTSVSSATGIASIAADIVADLSFGDYVAVAVDATHIDLYVNTNIDELTYDNDDLRLNSAPILITPATGITYLGVEFTGGVTVTMTAGDKATFSVRPASNYLLRHHIGKNGSSPREFELTIAAERIGNKIRVVKYPRCIAAGGAGLKFLYKDWATFETTIKVLNDAVTQEVGLETIINR